MFSSNVIDRFDDGPDKLHKFVKDVSDKNAARLEGVFKNVKDFDDDGLESLGFLTEDVLKYSSDLKKVNNEKLVMMLSNPNYKGLSPTIYQDLVKGLDNLRDSSGKSIQGVISKPPAFAGIKKQPSPMITDLANGNKGHAFEVTKTDELIKSGQVPRDNIDSMGKKMKPPQKEFKEVFGKERDSIEADMYLKDGTFIDFKNDNNGPDLEDITALALTMKATNTPIKKAVYLKKGGLKPADTKLINSINNDYLSGTGIPPIGGEL